MIPPEVSRWIRDRRAHGYGEGAGAEYRPWLTVRDFGSRGNVHRPLGRNGRTYQLFSTREYKAFLLLQWSPLVVDVREQYPLHPLEETVAIAAQLSVRHPEQTRKRNGVSQRRVEPMTTDFLVTLREAGTVPRFMAVSVKPEEALEDSPAKVQRMLEKTDIERCYFAARGVPFRLVTDAEMPAVRCANIELVLPWASADGLGLEAATIPAHLKELFDALQRAPDRALREVCTASDRAAGRPLGTSLSIVWHAIASKQWAVDMDAPLDPESPLRGLRMSGGKRPSRAGRAA